MSIKIDLTPMGKWSGDKLVLFVKEILTLAVLHAPPAEMKDKLSIYGLENNLGDKDNG